MRAILMLLLLAVFFGDLVTGVRVVVAKDEIAAKESDTLSKLFQATNHRSIHNYRTHCAHCHGVDGRPRALIERVMPEAPDFSLIQWRDYEAGDFVESIADGVGQMPAFKNLLTTSEIRSLSHLLTTFPKGKPRSLIRRRWEFHERDQTLREQISELRLSVE